MAEGEPCSRLDRTGALPELEQALKIEDLGQFARLYKTDLDCRKSDTPCLVIGSTILSSIGRKRGVSEQVFPIFTKGKQLPAWGACMTRAGSRHGAWDQHFFFSPRQPLHSINHMFYSGTLAFMTFFFRFWGLYETAYYAAYL